MGDMDMDMDGDMDMGDMAIDGDVGNTDGDTNWDIINATTCATTVSPALSP